MSDECDKITSHNKKLDNQIWSIASKVHPFAAIPMSVCLRIWWRDVARKSVADYFDLALTAVWHQRFFFVNSGKQRCIASPNLAGLFSIPDLM